MKINTFLLSMAIAVSSSPVLSSRYMSGSTDVQREEFVSNTSTQQIQTNEQVASGQLSPSQANEITNQQQNMFSQQREVDAQVGGLGAVTVNPPPNFYNQAQQEQFNLQENSIDTKLNTTGASASSTVPVQQNNQVSSMSNSTSNINNAPANGSAASSYGP